ncbi:STAS/SEC14 domain-containing protein [candidate division WOR-3 bacterium]|nr:STAS/SEC14 domain-containing protein [candidate division WOR-3 bacterium]
MKRDIRYNKAQDALYARISGEIAPREFQEMSQVFMSFPAGQRSRILIDIAGLKMPKWDRETRKRLAESSPVLSENKVALIGAPPALRILSKVFSYISQKKAKAKSKQPQETMFFKTEGEALSWLKGEKS